MDSYNFFTFLDAAKLRDAQIAPLQLGRLEQCEGSFLCNEAQPMVLCIVIKTLCIAT